MEMLGMKNLPIAADCDTNPIDAMGSFVPPSIHPKK